jgi:hypothetical protein
MRGPEALTPEYVALFDAGAFRNPGVTRVHHARKFRIGEQIRRQIAMDSSD